MKTTTAAVLATLTLGALLGGNASASPFAVTIATPHFGLRVGTPVFAPPVAVPAPVHFAPLPVVAAPRVVVMPPVYPVVYPYAVVSGGKHRRHVHRGHHHVVVPVAGYAYGRY